MKTNLWLVISPAMLQTQDLDGLRPIALLIDDACDVAARHVERLQASADRALCARHLGCLAAFALAEHAFL